MKILKWLIGLMLFSFAFMAFAQVVLPDLATSQMDVGQIIIYCITNGKALGPVGLGAMFVFLLVQVSKARYFDGFFNKVHPALKRLLIFVFGSVYAVLYSMFGGAKFGPAIMVAVVSTNVATGFWEVVSPFFKPKAVK